MNTEILKLINSPAFQELTSYYNEKTMFSTLHVERNENRHSAFLGWWLNPCSEHGLGDAPLKLFLRLLATKKWGVHTFGEYYNDVLAGGYEVEVVEDLQFEKHVGDIASDGSSRDKIDIWTVIAIKKSKGDENGLLLPIVIENKIYSNEGKGQTLRYFQAVQSYLNSCDDNLEKGSALVFLTPKDKSPQCNQFVNIIYQDVLTYVIEPLLSCVSSGQQKFVESYVRNLGRPSSDSRFGVLAVSAKEKKMLDDVYAIGGGLIEAAFAAIYPLKDVKSVLGEDRYIEAESKNIDNNADVLLKSLWDANEDVFKALIFNRFASSSAHLTRLFKTSNRDNSKYRIYHRSEEIFPGKRLSKTKAACAIFKAYLRENPATTLDQLRELFTPEKVNHYYLDRYYNDLFMPYRPDNLDDSGYQVVDYTVGKLKGHTALAKWDFLCEPEYTLELENGATVAMCVKWWRKPDFDLLLKAIKEMRYIKVECL